MKIDLARLGKYPCPAPYPCAASKYVHLFLQTHWTPHHPHRLRRETTGPLTGDPLPRVWVRFFREQSRGGIPESPPPGSIVWLESPLDRGVESALNAYRNWTRTLPPSASDAANSTSFPSSSAWWTHYEHQQTFSHWDLLTELVNLVPLSLPILIPQPPSPETPQSSPPPLFLSHVHPPLINPLLPPCPGLCLLSRLSHPVSIQQVLISNETHSIFHGATWWR